MISKKEREVKRYFAPIAVAVLVLSLLLGTGCRFQERAAGIDDRITTLE